MALEACVYCACFEKGLLRSSPRPEWRIHVDETGARARQNSTGGLEDDLAFDGWNKSACDHDGGMLLHHRIGHIANVSLLRQVLTNQSKKAFPLILSTIIYNGVHCGDFIAADQVALLKPELQELTDVHCEDTLAEELIRHFEQQLRELVDTAMKIRKPIVF